MPSALRLLLAAVLVTLPACSADKRKVEAVNGLPFDVTLVVHAGGEAKDIVVPSKGRVPLDDPGAASFEVKMPNGRTFKNGSLKALKGDASETCTTFINVAGSASIHKIEVAYGIGHNRVVDRIDGRVVKKLCAPYNLHTDPPPEAVSVEKGKMFADTTWVRTNGDGDWIEVVRGTYTRNSLNPNDRIGPWNILLHVVENAPQHPALPSFKAGALASCDVLLDLDEQPSPFDKTKLLVESPRKKCKRQTVALFNKLK